MRASLDREIQIREYGRMANMADPFGNGFDLGSLGVDAVLGQTLFKRRVGSSTYSTLPKARAKSSPTGGKK